MDRMQGELGCRPPQTPLEQPRIHIPGAAACRPGRACCKQADGPDDPHGGAKRLAQVLARVLQPNVLVRLAIEAPGEGNARSPGEYGRGRFGQPKIATAGDTPGGSTNKNMRMPASVRRARLSGFEFTRGGQQISALRQHTHAGWEAGGAGCKVVVCVLGFRVCGTPGEDGHHADVDEQRDEQRDGALYGEVRDRLPLPRVPGRVNLPARQPQHGLVQVWSTA